MVKKVIVLCVLMYSILFNSAFSQVIEIGDGGLLNQSLPIEPNYGYSYSQVLYYGYEIGGPKIIHVIEYHYTAADTFPDTNEIDVYMGHTDKGYFANNDDWVPYSDLTQVATNVIWSIQPGDNWVTIILDQPFLYSGFGNLVVAIDENRPDYDNSSDDFYCTSWPLMSRGMVFYADDTNPDPVNPPTATYLRDSFANIKLHVQEPIFGDLEGYITDSQSGQPILDATVTCGFYTAATEPSGYYFIPDIPIGMYDVTVTHAQYFPSTIPDVIIQEDMTTQQDFSLDYYYPPEISITPQSFDFSFDLEEQQQILDTLHVSNPGVDDLIVTLEAIIPQGVSPWLSVEPTQAIISSGQSASFIVTAEIGGNVWTGEHSSEIQIHHNVEEEEANPLIVPVTMEVSGGAAQGNIWPTEFSDYLLQGDALHHWLWIGNDTDASAILDWEIVVDPEAIWLTVEPSSGQTAPDSSQLAIITVNDVGLELGIHQTNFIVNWWDINGNSGTQNIYVAMEVYNPNIEFDPTFASITVDLSGDSLIAYQSFTISNTGTGPLNCYLDTEYEIADDSTDFFTAYFTDTEEESGTIWSNQSAEVTIRVDATGVVGGTYYGVVYIEHNDPEVDNPFELAVAIHLSYGTGWPYIWPVEFTEVLVQGEERSDLLWVGNSTNSTSLIDWEIDVEYLDGSDWLTVEPTEGYGVEPGEADRVVLTMDSEGLPLGTYVAVLHVTCRDTDNNHSTTDIFVGMEVYNPNIFVDPAFLQFDLNPEESTQDSLPLTIYNTGTGPLIFNLDVETANQSLSITGKSKAKEGELNVKSKEKILSKSKIPEADKSKSITPQIDSRASRYDWLSVEPEQGIAYPGEPFVAMVHVNGDSIVAGSWYGVVNIHHNDPETESPVSIPVMTDFISEIQSTVTIPPEDQYQYLCRDNQKVVEMTISNDESANALLDFTITADASWLSADPWEGEGIWPGQSEVVDIIFDATDLDDGVYTTELLVTCSGYEPGDVHEFTFDLTMEVYHGQMRVEPEMFDINFSLDEILTDTLYIYNDGTGPMDWHGWAEEQRGALSSKVKLNAPTNRSESILVWNPATGQSEISGLFFEAWLEDDGYDVTYHTSSITDFTLDDLSNFDMIFACFGISGFGNYTINADEKALCQAYLDLGGKAMYAEGGDFWAYDSFNLEEYFNINGISDGSGNLVTVEGVANTVWEDYTGNYTGANNLIDHIEAIEPAYNALQANEGAYYTGVGYYNEEADYYTFGTSFLLGAMDNASELMYLMMNEHFDLFYRWLSIEPQEGTVYPGDENAQMVEVTFDMTETWAGAYYGNINIQSSCSPENPYVEIPVVLTIGPNDYYCSGYITPTDVLEYLQAGEIGVETGYVGNRIDSNALMYWTLTEIDDVPWLDINPTEGNGLIPGEGQEVVYNFTTPTEPGTYTTELEFHWWGGDSSDSTMIIPVTLELHEVEMAFEPQYIMFPTDNWNGEQDSTWLYISNSGVVPLNVELSVNPMYQEMLSRARSAQSKRATATSKRMNNGDDIEQTTRFMENKPSSPVVNYQPLNPGDVINQWSTGLSFAWGLGYAAQGNDENFIWLSDINTYTAYEYETDGTPTGREVPLNFGGANLWGDMAYDSVLDAMWIVNLSGDNSITLFSPESGEELITLTGEWSYAIPKGIAYDSESDELYIGGWGYDVIYVVQGLNGTSPGDTIRTIPAPPFVAGLAYSCEDHRVWVTTNSADDYIYELDAQTGEILTTLGFPDPVGFTSAGCEMDHDGNLWLVSRESQTVYQIDTDAEGGCYPEWLFISPTTGTINGGEVDSFLVSIDMSDYYAGIYYGTIQIDHNDLDVVSPIDIPLVVGNQSYPSPEVGPYLFDVQLSQGSEPAVEQLWITNGEDSQILMGWEIIPHEDGISDWLEFSALTGEPIAPGDTTFVDLTFNPAGLTVGTYSTEFTTYCYGPEEEYDMYYTHYVFFSIYNPDIAIQPENGFVGENKFLLYPDDDVLVDTLFIANLADVGTLICNLTASSGERSKSKEPISSSSLSKGKSLSKSRATGSRDRNWLSVEPMQVSVESEDTVDVVVSVSGAELDFGVHWGEIAIQHNDPDVENPLIVPVQVIKMTEPNTLHLSTHELYMGQFSATSYDNWVEDSITLTNIGTIDMVWNAEWTEEWMIVDPASGTLGCAESVELAVLTNVGYAGLGIYQDTLSFWGGPMGPQCNVWFEIVDGHFPPFLDGDCQFFVHEVRIDLWWEDLDPDPVDSYLIYKKHYGEEYDSEPYDIITDPEVHQWTDYCNYIYEECGDLCYAIKAVFASGDTSFISDDFCTPSKVKDKIFTHVPERFSLSQNYPNPFNPETEIFYSIPNTSRVTLEVYTVNGQLVRSLVDEDQAANFYSVLWDGKDSKGKPMPGGVYIYTLSAGDYHQSKRMILLK